MNKQTNARSGLRQVFFLFLPLRGLLFLRMVAYTLTKKMVAILSGIGPQAKCKPIQN